MTAHGPPIPARHASQASTSTDATSMATASALGTGQVRKQVAPQIRLPLPAPRKPKPESTAARKQRRKTNKGLAADSAGASAADASAPILSEPSLNPSLLENTHHHRHRPRKHQSAGALKRKADRAARLGPLWAAAPPPFADADTTVIMKTSIRNSTRPRDCRNRWLLFLKPVTVLGTRPD